MAQPASEYVDPAVIVVNPGDTVTAETFQDWLDERADDEPTYPDVTAAETLRQARAADEV